MSGRTYVFEKNDQDVDAITLDLNERGATLTIQDSNGTHQVVAGHGAWLNGTTTLFRGQVYSTAASGAWISDDTYVLRVYFNETPFCSTITLRFSADQLVTVWKDNVGFGPTEHPQLVGRSA